MNKILAFLCAVSVTFLNIGEPRAEYAENGLGRDFAEMTLASGGSVAVGFDVASTIYLSRGPGHAWGRIASGIGSIGGGAFLGFTGVLSILLVSKSSIPLGGEGGPEDHAFTTARVLGGVELGLAAASIGLGIASLTTYRSHESHEKDGVEPPHAFNWHLVPVALPGGGGSMMAVGQF
jgi:hypothetical protein